MHESETETASIRDYLRPLKGRWWLIVLIALIAAGGTYQSTRGKPKTYSATTQIYLQGSSLDAVLDSGGNSQPDRAARNQAILLRTTPVAREAAKRLKFKGDPRALLPLISASPASEADFLTLTSTAPSSQTAIAVVNAFAQAYIARRTAEGRAANREALDAAEQRLDALAKTPDTAADRASIQDDIQRLRLAQDAKSGLQQIEPARSATVTSSNPKRSAIFALALGGLLGALLVYAFEFFDRRIKRADEIGPLHGRAVLVGVPRGPKGAAGAAASRGLQPPFTESFRALRTSLQLKATGASSSNGHATRIILVTSAVPQEGKSTVARNLALAYYEAGLRVAIVDADLRRPQVARSFGLADDDGPGLSDVLSGEIDLRDAVREVEIETKGRQEMVRARELALRRTAAPPAAYAAGDGEPEPRSGVLSVLSSGATPSDPAAALTAGGLSSVFGQLSGTHDIVIVDSAPLLVVSDAVPLLSAVDGVLLVSRVNLTTTADVAQLNELLDRVPNVDVLGVVANDIRETASPYGYGARAGSRGRSS